MINFTEIDIKKFKDSILLIDIDGTIVPDGGNRISYKSANKIKELSQKNEIYLCSNKSENRTAKFAKVLGVSWIGGKKPFSVKMPNFDKNKRVVVIGDKYLTDGLFARRIKAEFLKVKCIVSEKETAFIKFSYWLDNLAFNAISYLKLIRIWQWAKNLLIFAPLFFAGSVFVWGEALPAVLAFFAFSLAASCVYIFNDILDRGSDALHHKKKNRPLASGAISLNKAGILMFVLAAAAALLTSFVTSILWPLIIYVALNLLYSLKLKHVAILDIILVSVFYLLRLAAGGLATDIYLSPWIIICVFFGSLFLILGKRRAEHGQENRREVLEDYSIEALNFMLGISASLTIITYGIWSVIEHNISYLVYSTIFVVFVFFKILNKMYTHPKEAESPETMVFKDKWIFFSFILWVIYLAFVFY